MKLALFSLHTRVIGLLAVCVMAGWSRSAAATPPLLGVQAVAAGGSHSCVIIKGGAQCWGSNFFGQLGIGMSPDSPTAAQVVALDSGVTSISAGYAHSCAIVNGAVLCWGLNQYGELGSAVGYTSLTPVAVGGLASPVGIIAAGQYHTCAIVNGGAQCWGADSYGQLGNGATTDSTMPTSVTGLGSGVTGIAAGAYHSCAIVNGAAQCWGYGADGELGNGSNGNSSTAVAVTGLGSGSGVTAIVAGGYHNCALVGGGVQCWGEAPANGAGIGSNIASTVPGLGSGVIALAAGGTFNCAIVSTDAAHPVKCWGSNYYGQLGNGSTTSTPNPVDVTFSPPLAAGDSVTGIATGNQHACATIASGGVTRMSCWGDNTNGELGISTVAATRFTAAPVSGLDSGVTAIGNGSSATHFCAIVAGAAKCWGGNSYGQLGNGSSVSSATPQAVTGLSTGVTALALGEDHTCAIVNGAEQCWGTNQSGQLGNGSGNSSATPVSVSGLTSGVTATASGASHSCAVVNGGALCWGNNLYGQLGNGTTNQSPTPQAVTGLGAGSGVTAIAAGALNTCAIVNGAVQCWGLNNTGQLGDGTLNNSPVPVAVVGLSTGVTSIALATFDGCATVGSGASSTVKCWGDNSDGEFGTGMFTSGAALTTAFGGVANTAAIVAGSYFNCALVGGEVQCAGYDANGQLGRIISGYYDPSPGAVTGLPPGVTSIAASNSAGCAITSVGGAVCWGDDRYGQLGDNRVLGAETAQTVLAGDEIFGNGFDD